MFCHWRGNEKHIPRLLGHQVEIICSATSTLPLIQSLSFTLHLNFSLRFPQPLPSTPPPSVFNVSLMLSHCSSPPWAYLVNVNHLLLLYPGTQLACPLATEINHWSTFARYHMWPFPGLCIDIYVKNEIALGSNGPHICRQLLSRFTWEKSDHLDKLLESSQVHSFTLA